MKVMLSILLMTSLCGPAVAAAFLETVQIPVQDGAFNFNPAANQFDPRLGTLNQLLVRLSSSFSGSAVTVIPPNSQGIYLAELDFSDALVDSERYIEFAYTEVATNQATCFEVMCSASVQVSYNNTFNDSALLTSGPDNLSEFIGTGDIPFVFNGATDYEETSGSSSILATLRIAYFYTPVPGSEGAPEPAAWTLVTLGLSVLGVALRGKIARPA